MSKLIRARLLIVGGGVFAAAGVWLQFGHGYGLIAAGAFSVAYGLLLVDVDEPAKEVRR